MVDTETIPDDQYTEDPTDDELLAAEMGIELVEKSWGDKAVDALLKARGGGHRYISRKWVKDHWEYKYPEDLKKKPKAAKPEEKKPGRNWVEHKPGLPSQTVHAQRIHPPPAKAPPLYKMRRQLVHAEIIQKFLQNSRGEPIRPQEKKVAIVMMGGTASGKTTAVKRMLGVGKGQSIEDHGFVNFNPDDVKEMLPEYKESIDFTYQGQKATAKDAAWMVHEESSDIAQDVLTRALENNLNVIVDGTGKNADKHIARIRDLKAKGYEVRLLMPDVDVEGSDGAVSRSIARAERSGRFVPIGSPPPGAPDVLRDIHYQIPGNFERVAREADQFTLFCGRDFPPVVKWEGGKDLPDKIHDSNWVESFKKRGAEMAKKHKDWKRRLKENPSAPAPKVEPYKKGQLQKSDNAPEEEQGPVKFPGAGRNGQGVEWVEWDGYDPDRLHKIEYA